MKELQAVIKSAEQVLENAKTQAAIDEALTKLEQAVGNLEVEQEPDELSKAALQEKVAEVKAIDLAGYTNDSVAALTEAIELAEAALETAKTQAEIDQALAKLEAAVENLEKVEKVLDEKLVEAEAIDPAKYTAESIAALNDAIELARRALEKPENQKELAKALETLEAALANLEAIPRELLTEELEAKLTEAKAIDVANYTKESVAALTEAVKLAEEVLQTATTQVAIDDALSSLETAIAGLKEASEELSKEALQEKLTEAKAIDVANYTKESVAALTEAVKLAEEVLQTATTQAAIDEALSSLETAIAGLKKASEELSKEALQEKLTEAKAIDVANYTKDSVSALTEAIGLTETALETASIQEEIDQALEELIKAIDALIEIETPVNVDKSALQKLVNDNQNKKSNDYTEQTWNTFSQALDQAEKVVADEKATQTEVDQAMKNLTQAIQALEKKVEDIPTNEKDSDNGKPNTDKNTGDKGQSDDGKKLPTTASMMFNILLVGLILTVFSSVLLFSKRNKNRRA